MQARHQELYDLDPSLRISLQLTADESLGSISDKIYNSISEDLFMIRFQQLAWDGFKESKKSSLQGDLNGLVMSYLEDSGMKEVIVNSALRIYEKSISTMTRSDIDHSRCIARTTQDESSSSIREARHAWEEGINEELLSIVGEMRRPMSVIRPPGSVNPFLVDTVCHIEDAPDSIRFLFDSEDLLETAVAIQSRNVKTAHMDRALGVLKLPISTPRLDDLISRYPELSSSLVQLGLDEMNVKWGIKVVSIRHDEAEAISSTGNAIDARKFLRRGAPPAIRPKMWRVALGLPAVPTDAEVKRYQYLRAECDRIDLITDELFIHDVQNVVDDTRFFPFEDEIKESALCFARDETVRTDSIYEIHKPLCDPDMAQASATGVQFCPPCGVQPFLGLANYIAPVCYVFRHRPSIFSVSRALWCRLWCKLNVLSEDSGTLLYLCKTFEDLLASTNPRLFLHLTHIGLQPLQIAFPWLQLCFAGHLEMDQLLILWDRVIGYMDVTLFAVLAVAIFLARSEALMMCTSAEHATLMVCELSRLHVVPLLQMLLLSDKPTHSRETS